MYIRATRLISSSVRPFVLAQVTKNTRIEAEVQRRLEMDQQLQHATAWGDKQRF